MKKSTYMRAWLAVAAMAAIGLLAQPVFAQRGGGHGGGGGGFHGGGGFGGGGFHGGGGGFHGGGGFSGGGRAFTGFHGGGGFSGRGGFGGRGFGGRGFGGRGFGGRGFGFRGRGFDFDRDFDFGFGFGFGYPWWGFGFGYPYYGFYGYPYYYPPYPYYYPSYDYGDSYDSPDPYNGGGDPPPADPNARPRPNQYRPRRPGRPAPQQQQGPSQPGQPAPQPQGTGDITYPNNGTASYDQPPAVRSVDRIFTASPSAYRVIRRNADQRHAQSDAPVRPEVQRARQRLREMPPFAREREIEVRYNQFSPEEKELLLNGD